MPGDIYDKMFADAAEMMCGFIESELDRNPEPALRAAYAADLEAYIEAIGGCLGALLPEKQAVGRGVIVRAQQVLARCRPQA